MKIEVGDWDSEIWGPAALALVLVVSLAGCQRLDPLALGTLAAPDATPIDTPSSEEEQDIPLAMGNPPGPVLAIAPLSDGEFLAGVGPIGSAESGFEWRLYRGREDDWRPLSWPPEVIPRSLHAATARDLASSEDVLYAIPFSNALFGRGQAWGLMRSRDEGRSWQQILTGLGDPYVMDLALSPATSGGGNRTLFVVTWYSGVYRSANDGETWEAMPLDAEVEPSGGANPYDLAIAVSPDYEDSTGNGVMMASFSRQLHRWDRQAQAWRTSSLTVTATLEDFDPAESHLTAGSIVFSPDFDQDGTIYLYSGYAGLFRSTDKGQTWQDISRRLSLPPPIVTNFHLAVASADEAYVLLDTDQADPRLGRPVSILYRTRDGGRLWEALTDPPTIGWVSTFALTLDEEGQAVLHLGGSQGGISSHVADALSWD